MKNEFESARDRRGPTLYTEFLVSMLQVLLHSAPAYSDYRPNVGVGPFPGGNVRARLAEAVSVHCLCAGFFWLLNFDLCVCSSLKNS